ncbi:MAG TPA: hypothetical protein VNG73_11195 [Gemmatimonadaceae bacterium]|nr:hypothetical protein [Gemmatimonadaceae bacterium]
MMRSVLDDARGGVCVCGRPVAAHYSARNHKWTCEELAEHEDAIAAAACCTSPAEAQRAAGAQLLDESRF